MPDCDYCGASFDDEDAYLAHLDAEHRGELGRIDRRRIDDVDDEEDDLPIGLIAIGIIFVGAAVVVGYIAFGGGGSGPSTGADAGGIEAQPLPDSGDQALLQNVQQYPSEGTQHVSPDTEVEYNTTPPTSGNHYDATVSAGFYTQTQSAGEIVHTLEHGAVVIYYDEDALSPEAERSLREWASVHTGTWQSVVVVPNPYDEVDSPFVLTAWRHSLQMSEYDAEVVQAFLAEYLGRGPENPVR
jgi:hypothetical protein